MGLPLSKSVKPTITGYYPIELDGQTTDIYISNDYIIPNIQFTWADLYNQVTTLWNDPKPNISCYVNATIDNEGRIEGTLLLSFNSTTVTSIYEDIKGYDLKGILFLTAKG